MVTPNCSSPSSLSGQQRHRRPQQCHSAARHDAFLHCRASGMQSIFHARFLLFHLRLGGGADFDDRHAAGELRQPLLQLLAIVVGRGLFDLAAQLLDSAFNVLLHAAAVDDGGVVFSRPLRAWRGPGRPG